MTKIIDFQRQENDVCFWAFWAACSAAPYKVSAIDPLGKDHLAALKLTWRIWGELK